MDDTTPEIAAKVREMIRAKSPTERLQMGWSMYLTSKYLVTQGILAQKPDLSPTELKKELFLRFYGNDFDEKTCTKILAHLEAQGCTRPG
jgi:hypothetical protein